MFKDFFNLIFPRICVACSEALLKNEQTLCEVCKIKLPKTENYLDKENVVNKIFWGRSKIEMAASYYKFSKKSKVQHILHQLKYKGNKEVGEIVGRLYGDDLKDSIHYQHIDVIIPVPLHYKKQKRRGYNQSEFFAKGLSETMKIPLNTTCLYRKIDSQTQTQKSRYDRWENVNEIFEVKNPNVIKGQSILLVDDVITTGATIEACIQILQPLNCKIYVAAIAFA